MKNNWKLLWNPFIRIAGMQAFIVGIILAGAAAILGQQSSLAFDGAIDAHTAETVFSIGTALLYMLINIVSVAVMLYAGALLLTRNFRFIDILGTTTFARYPFLILAVVALFTKFPAVDELMANPLLVMSNPSFIIFSFVAAIVVVWFIALLLHAFRTSVGVKTRKATLIFILALLLAETVSKVLIAYATNHLNL